MSIVTPDKVIPTEIVEADLVPQRYPRPYAALSDAEERRLNDENTGIRILVVLVAIAVVIGMFYLLKTNP